jgi:signal transduction histidine kinase
MQERARRLGGRLDVRTAAAGTRVELRFPAVSDRDRAPAGAPSEGRAEAKVEP